MPGHKIDVLIADNEEQMKDIWAIRRTVFVEEQQVEEQEEFEYEDESVQFLAKVDAVPAGTARWRETTNGVKLERFAVLIPYRSSGIGSALLKAILEHIPSEHRFLYLHAQLTAVGLYRKFGFEPVGEQFEEAGIQHYKMILNRN